ncbi:MAG: hypothetical protein HYZ23_04950 [Chloroflexi bacterium]|nr:hypothetical protein [Chloroflexota bacterium]
MIVTAWNNGQHFETGAGYGIKINAEDRDKFFKREWKFITLQFEDSTIQTRVNIDKNSFWNSTCRELINMEIGMWLRNNHFATWPKNQPPKFRLESLPNHCFLLGRL